VRYHWLVDYLFDTLDKIQDFATRWLWTCNHDRPNIALGGIAPSPKFRIKIGRKFDIEVDVRAIVLIALFSFIAA
jgi:hypothetical protein